MPHKYCRYTVISTNAKRIGFNGLSSAGACGSVLRTLRASARARIDARQETRN